MGIVLATTGMSADYFNPLSGRCGLPVGFQAVSDLLYTDVITFSRSSSLFTNNITIGSSASVTYTSISAALALQSHFSSRGFNFSFSNLGNAYGYSNVLEITYVSGGTEDPSFSLDFKGPFYFQVLVEHTATTNFKCFIATTSNPTSGDFIVINPPPDGLGVEMTHVWNYGGEQSKLVSHKLHPQYFIDKETNEWKYILSTDLTRILKDSFTINTPVYNWQNTPSWEFKLFHQPHACKSITTYFSLVKDGVDSRTQQALPAPINQETYYFGPYEVYMGSCRFPDGSLVDPYDYHKLGLNFIYPLKSAYKELDYFQSDICVGDTYPYYVYLPENQLTGTNCNYVVYDKDNNILFLDTQPMSLDSTEAGIYYWDLGYLVNRMKDTYPSADRVNVSLLEDNSGEYSTFPFDINILENDCEECGRHTQFIYLSSMGIYEQVRLYYGESQKVEGKAVDITHDTVGFSESSLYRESKYSHRNRGIRSSESKVFYSSKLDSNTYEIDNFMDFISSQDIYEVVEYGRLRACRISHSSFETIPSNDSQKFEVSIVYLSTETYTNNLV